MVHCAAIKCTSSSSKKTAEKISFFKLPRDKKLKKSWVAKLKRVNLPKEENISVCHHHFEQHCFQRDLKNELLALPPRRILTNDAVPTLFSYTVPPTKRKCNKQQEISTKRQLINDAIKNNEQIEKLDKENEYYKNSKGSQTDPLSVDATTQTYQI